MNSESDRHSLMDKSMTKRTISATGRLHGSSSRHQFSKLNEGVNTNIRRIATNYVDVVSNNEWVNLFTHKRPTDDYWQDIMCI